MLAMIVAPNSLGPWTFSWFFTIGPLDKLSKVASIKPAVPEREQQAR